MKWLLLLLLFPANLQAKPALQQQQPPAEKGPQVLVEYPAVLQKAGVRKARCIFKDSRGLVWIGTENGLYRYDGTNVDYLVHRINDFHTIPNNNIVNITEDRQSKIWVGTMGGIACLDAYALDCRVYSMALGNFGGDFDSKVYINKAGEIWAGTSTGLYLFNAKKNNFQLKWSSAINGKNGSAYITSLTDWKGDTLVAGTFADAVLINKNNFGSRRLAIAGGNVTVNCLFVDDRKRIWMGTWEHGCIVSDAQCKTFYNLLWEKPHERESVNIVTNLMATHYGHAENLWISTLKGVYKVNGYLAAEKNYKVSPVLAGFDGRINAMMADDDQYIWLAGFGVSQFFAGQRFFTPAPLQLNGVLENIKEISLRGKRYKAFLGWYASGLLVTDSAGKSVVYRQNKQKNPEEDNVSGMVVDKYGRLWISSFAGVKILNSKFKPGPVYPKISVDNSLLTSLKTIDMQILHDTVWISCYKRGIDLFDLNFHKLKTFLKNDGSGLKDELVERIFTDSRGNVWLCGNSYLYRYIPAKSKFLSYNLSGENASFSVNDVAELPDHELLVASSAGLFRFDPQSAKSSRIYSPLLSKDVDVQSACADAWGDIWFTTKEHLVYYRTKTQQFTLFGEEDGLNTSNDLDLLRTFDGKKFYVAAYDKLVSFSSQAAQRTSKPIGLYLHAVQVNDSLLSSMPAPGKQLDLKYDQNRVLVEFGAINFIKPEQNRYAFRLSGVDDNWISAIHNYASYANLAPGTYTLHIKAENASGLWSRPIELTFRIAPPYWGTWWFRLISLVLISSALLIAIRFVLQRNLREKILKLEKEQAVEIERNRIARDMHDDLGSGLTKIAILSEVTKAHIKNEASATASLDIISAASRELVDNLQDIIWVLNPKNDSVESLILYLKEYAESFFEHTPVSLRFDCDQEAGHISLSEEKRRNIFLVVKEACNNILKHAGATTVNINIGVEGDGISIEIADDGRGFEDGSTARFSNGLQNMKNRIQQINGEFLLISSPGNGTLVNCRIPV